VYEFTRLKLGFGHLRMLSGQTKQGRLSPDFNLRQRSGDANYRPFTIRRNCISLLMEINTGFWLERLRGRDHLEHVGLNWRVRGHMDWVGLAQDRYRWRFHVYAVMNLRVP
jgi:hypothetical protein